MMPSERRTVVPSIANSLLSVDVSDFQRRVGHFHRPFWVERDVAHQPLLSGRKLEGLPFHVV